MGLELKKAGRFLYDQREIPLVCPVKNEEGLLPHFLDHHRKIGVQNFIFIDNNSDDKTREILLSQDDCSLYFTEDSFVESKFATDWISEILNKHASNRWGIYLDCDELLVYEKMETVDLVTFVEKYAINGADSFWSIMVDMYPEGDWKNISAKNIKSIKESIPCFDKDYIIRQRPTKPWEKKQADAIEILGGPRGRLFSSLEKENRKTWLYYMAAGQIDRFIRYVPIQAMPFLVRAWPRPMTAQFKNPINFIGPNFRYTYSHGSTNRSKAGTMLGILHLKFCDELNARFDPEFSYKNHYRRGLERFRLSMALDQLGDNTLLYEGTQTYLDSDSLSEVMIIGEEAASVWFQNQKAFVTGGVRVPK